MGIFGTDYDDWDDATADEQGNMEDSGDSAND